MKILYLICLIPFLYLSCRQPDANKQHNTISTDKAKLTKIDKPNASKEAVFTELIDNTYGVVTIDETQEFKDTVSFNIYNLDSTLWKKVTFSSNMIDKFHISPYVFNYDNYIMVFRCTGISGNYYKVIIDENKRTEKLMPFHQKYLVFETWSQHIIKKAFAVDFQPLTNPLRLDASDLARTLPFNKDQFYHPVIIKGAWLKVKDDNGKEAWIKWRSDKGQLLVKIYYDA